MFNLAVVFGTIFMDEYNTRCFPSSVESMSVTILSKGNSFCAFFLNNVGISSGPAALLSYNEIMKTLIIRL